MTASAHGPSDRTRRWLNRIGVDLSLVADRAQAIDIELTAASLNPSVEIALAMTATLLLRLDELAPAIRIVVPHDRTVQLPRMPDTSLPDAIATSHFGFASLDRLHTRPSSDPELRLVFSGNANGLQVSTAGWAVSVGTALEGVGNGISASYAGVLAAAEALKVILTVCGSVPPRMRLWRGITSIWDYTLTSTPGPPLEAADLGTHVWAGAGGVASATSWALAAAAAAGASITGDGIVADNDAIDDDATNLNRHLTAGMNDLGIGKAQLLADLLGPAGLHMTPVQAQWNELSETLRRPALAVVSIDSDPGRRQIQFEMPRVILNAGTGDHGEYQVSRHDFLSGAGLCCIARADKLVASPEEALAARLEIPVDELTPHLHSDDPLPDALLASLTENDRAGLRDVCGRDLLQKFCGSLMLPNNGPAVSAPMISAAAGVLLAAELIKHQAPGRAALCNGQVALANILIGPHPRWVASRTKHPNCACCDPIYSAFYRDCWIQELGSPPGPQLQLQGLLPGRVELACS